MTEENVVFKEVSADVWKPGSAGESISGVFVRKEPKLDKLSARYFLETKEGIRLIWGSAVLDDRMQFVNIGDLVRVTFVQKKKNKRNQDLNIYKVEVATSVN